MEELFSEVSRLYEIKIKRAARDKAGFVCGAESGDLRLTKIPSETSHIMFQHGIKEKLFERGFSRTDRFYLNSEGLPYFSFGGDNFALTEAYAVCEDRFSDAGRFMELVKTLAEMNGRLFGEDLSAYAPEFRPPAKNRAEIYRGLKRVISKKTRLSDFDVIFLRNYEYFLGAITFWDSFDKESDRESFCHNLLKEENVYGAGDGPVIANFSECGPGSSVADLAAIIKRYFSRAAGSPGLNILDIVERYNSERPLGPGELRRLYAELVFPDKFFKIVTQFYEKKRSWVPANFIDRLNAAVAAKDAYAGFIKPLA